jgi:hypothetical protein
MLVQVQHISAPKGPACGNRIVFQQAGALWEPVSQTGDDVLAANARARTPHSHRQGSVRWPSPPMLGWGFDPSVMKTGDKGDAD